MHLASLYPPLDAVGQTLYLVAMIAMTIRGWWRRYPLFYFIQAAQFGELLWLLYIFRTQPYTRARADYFLCFWPNLVAECFVIATCFMHWNFACLAPLGVINAMHLQARYLHTMSYDVPNEHNFGWEYLMMKLANLAIYPVILWTLYYREGASCLRRKA